MGAVHDIAWLKLNGLASYKFVSHAREYNVEIKGSLQMGTEVFVTKIVWD